jgi:hypothetical protein
VVCGGEPPEVVGGGAACADAVPERLDGDVEADLATIFETIGDRLGRVGDGHFHLLDDMPFDTGRKDKATRRGAHQTDVLLSMVASSRNPMTSMPSALG